MTILTPCYSNKKLWKTVTMASSFHFFGSGGLFHAYPFPEGVEEGATMAFHPSLLGKGMSPWEAEECDHCHILLPETMAPFLGFLGSGGLFHFYPCPERARGTMTVASTLLYLEGESLLEKWRSVANAIPNPFPRINKEGGHALRPCPS